VPGPAHEPTLVRFGRRIEQRAAEAHRDDAVPIPGKTRIGALTRPMGDSESKRSVTSRAADT
jgi:hypothetical protein